ncbi:MAG: hypothetical protein HMLKMBBP_02104 [Planctomycetes bacterium]|nr:hypothetical protein [Planctomycetota bacterium]
MGDSQSSNVVFLLGAGASIAAGVPDTLGFAREFQESVRSRASAAGPAGGPDPDVAPSDAEHLDYVFETLKPHARERRVDIELLLEVLTRLADWDADTALAFCSDRELGRPGLRESAGRLARLLRDFIKSKAFVDPSRVQHLAPLAQYVTHHGRLDIATLNYDTAIEEFSAAHGIELHDGFRPEWSQDSIGKAAQGIRLMKLHGSVTWYQTPEGRYRKESINVPQSRVRIVQGGESESLMLFPVRKWAYSEPMVGLLFEFKRVLEAESTRVLVVAGYSFRDDHVKVAIRDAVRNNRRLEIVLLDPDAFGIKRRLLAPCGQDSWPEAMEPRILCLPYRFERLLPELKHRLLRSLLSGLDADEQERRHLAERGTKNSPESAMAHFADCQHVSRFESYMASCEPVRTAELTLREISVRLGQAICSDPTMALASQAQIIQVLRNRLVDHLYCDVRVGDRVVRANSEWRTGSQSHGGNGAAQLIEGLAERVQPYVRAALGNPAWGDLLVERLRAVSTYLREVHRLTGDLVECAARLGVDESVKAEAQRLVAQVAHQKIGRSLVGPSEPVTAAMTTCLRDRVSEILEVLAPPSSI